VQEEETLIEDCYDATREHHDIVLWLMKNKPWDFFWFSNIAARPLKPQHE